MDTEASIQYFHSKFSFFEKVILVNRTSDMCLYGLGLALCKCKWLNSSTTNCVSVNVHGGLCKCKTMEVSRQ